MKKNYHKIKSLLTRKQGNEIFENKIFAIVVLVVAATCFVGFCINVFIVSNFIINMIIGLLGITFSVFFYLSFFRGITKPLILPFQILCAFGLTLNWFYFQGIEGSMPMFFFPALFLLIYSNQEKRYWTIFVVYVSLAVVLTGIYFFNPEWAIHYADDNSRIIDLSLSFILSLFMIGYATIILKRNFDLERSKTEQKNKDLEISEMRFRDIALSSGDLIWEVDINGIFTYCSEKSEEIFGYKPNEMIGKTPFDFMTETEAEIGWKNFRQLVVERKSFKTMENWHLTKAGAHICVLTSGFPVSDRNGNLIGYRGTDTDITERKKTEEALKESEAKYRTLFTQMTEGFALHEVIYDADLKAIDYKIIDLNPSFEKQVGIQIERAKGRLATELYGVSSAPYLDIYSHVAETGEHQFFQSYFPPLNRCFEISVFSPNPGYFATVFADITERNKIEKALKENEVRLHELNATKDKFFSIISHDLKNPFNAIIGFSNILVEQAMEKDFDRIIEYARIIQDSSQRAMDLLLNLLEWSRSQSGRMEFNPEKIDIGTLINDVETLLNDAAEQKSISISTKYLHNATVFADRAMIGAILRNLISNAIKFTNPGGAIVISVEQDPDHLRVMVSDNGVGIKKGIVEKLFRIDETFSTAGTSNEEGTGLGLILCKEFVDKHGGEIWVESEVGKGSMFCFTIPHN